MKLKEYLTDIRKRLGLKYSARQFAKEVGITEGHLSKIVNGRQYPSFRLLKRIVECTKKKVRLEDFSPD